MATQKRDIIDVHVTDSKDVSLTVTIGNMQIGGSKVSWQGSNEILIQGKVVDFPLGKSSSLRGKTLLIETRFYDSNVNSNFISGMYDFNSGEEPIHVYYDSVTDQGDSFVFNISMTFQ